MREHLDTHGTLNALMQMAPAETWAPLLKPRPGEALRTREVHDFDALKDSEPRATPETFAFSKIAFLEREEGNPAQ